MKITDHLINSIMRWSVTQKACVHFLDFQGPLADGAPGSRGSSGQGVEQGDHQSCLQPQLLALSWCSVCTAISHYKPDWIVEWKRMWAFFRGLKWCHMMQRSRCCFYAGSKSFPRSLSSPFTLISSISLNGRKAKWQSRTMKSKLSSQPVNCQNKS